MSFCSLIPVVPSELHSQVDETWVAGPAQAQSVLEAAKAQGYAGVAFIYLDSKEGSYQVAIAGDGNELIHSFDSKQMKEASSMETMLAAFDIYGDGDIFRELDQEWLLAMNENSQALTGKNHYVSTGGRRGGFFQRFRRPASGSSWAPKNACANGRCNGYQQVQRCSMGSSNPQMQRFSQPPQMQSSQPQNMQQPSGWRNAVGGPNCESCNLGLLAGPRNLFNGNFIKARPRTRCDFMNLNVRQRLYSRAFPRLAFKKGLVGCCTTQGLLGQRFLAIVVGGTAGIGGAGTPALGPIFIP